MKKIFVLYICFCLLFSQNTFSVSKTVMDSSSDFVIEADIEKLDDTKNDSSKEEENLDKETIDNDIEKSEKSIDTTDSKNKKDVSKESEDEFSDSEEKIECTDQTCLPPAKDVNEEPVEKDPEKSTSLKKDGPELNTDQDDYKNTTNNSQVNESTVKNIELNSNDTTPKPAILPTESISTKIIPKSSITKKALETTIKPLSTPTNKKILITEILLDTSNSSSKYHEEYIELYNTTDEDINLSDYSLKRNITREECGTIKKDENLISSRVFSGIIKSHNYLVITHTDNPRLDLENSVTFSSKSATITKDSTILLYDNDDNIIDKVGFGNTCLPEGAPTLNPAKNESIERKKENGKYIDTQNNKDDFKINPCPFPGNYLPSNLSPNVRLNEIYADPCSNSGSSCTQTIEFIEIYNPDKISLKNWVIKDASKTGSYTILDNDNETNFALYTKGEHFTFALNNTNETVTLVAPDCSIASTVHYTKTQKGRSLNYGKTWYNSESTPGLQNLPDPRTLTYPQLHLSEILPNPSGDENTDEFIEIYNPNDKKVNLKNWIIKDGSKTGSYVFVTDEFIAPKSFFAIYRKDFSFALNNSEETISLIAPNERVVSTTSYIEPAKEDVSYNYNFTQNKWRWSKYLTPNKPNQFNNIPSITKFDIGDAYKDVYTEFEARASDKDNEKLKVRWDFGDGRRSYLWKTRHKYTNIGIYHGNLRIQDGSEEIIKKFTVHVKKYPKHKIKITKVVPNPAGKDSGHEYIIIKNEEDKKIDLKDWSIATGTSEKRLVNHPIYDKLTIKSNETKKITKKYTAISLPNKKGVVEVRRPNGSVADKLEYGDKHLSIPDNASYEKIDGHWTWLIPIDLEKQRQTQAIISQALQNEKILSQQILENKIAINAVYNTSKESSKNISKTETQFLLKIIQNINSLLHKTILITDSMFRNIFSTEILAYSYTQKEIELMKDPCKKPYLFNTPTSQKFDLCK